MYLTFAWRYFKAKKSANAINIIAWVTVGVIAFATCCQILVLSVFNGFEGLVKSLYGSFYTDLKITPAKGKTFVLTPQQIDAIKKSNGIDGISLIAEEKALLQNNDNDDSKQATITLKGVDENYKNITGVAEKTVMGKFETGNADNPKLVVGYGIQNNIDISVDDRFQPSLLTIILPKRGKVSAANPEESLSEGNATAAGVFAIQQEFDTRYAITNIDFVKQQMNFAPNEYSAVEIKLHNNADAALGKLQLQKILGANYNIKTKYQQNQSLYTTMKLEKWFIYAVLTLILLVAAFNMISALTMLVLEKQKDINILQGMGATKNMVLKIFLSEGLLLAGIGAVSGIVLALFICFLQIKFHLIKIQGGSFLIDYFPVKLEAPDFILVAVTVSVIAFIASWFPARKASKQSIELR
jgi:lipoprotein-releasing system permease protein